MLSNTLKGWSEHLKVGLERLANIPRDVGCVLTPLEQTNFDDGDIYLAIDATDSGDCHADSKYGTCAE